MNFKNVYKEANDEIKGDRSILEEIYAGKKVKKKNYKPLYRIAGTAAAVVVLCVATTMPLPKDRAPEGSSKNADKTELEVKSEEHDAEYDTTDKKTVENEDVSTSFKSKQGVSLGKSGVETEKHENEAYSETEDTASLEEAEAESVSEASETEVAVYADGADTAVASYGMSRALSGGGAYDPSSRKALIADEFFERIQLDKAKLEKDGYALTCPEKIKVLEQDGILSFSAELELAGDEAGMSIVICESFGDTETEITEYEGEVYAYADNGRIHVNISAYNISKDDVSEYIKGIMQ